MGSKKQQSTRPGYVPKKGWFIHLKNLTHTSRVWYNGVPVKNVQAISVDVDGAERNLLKATITLVGNLEIRVENPQTEVISDRQRKAAWNFEKMSFAIFSKDLDELGIYTLDVSYNSFPTNKKLEQLVGINHLGELSTGFFLTSETAPKEELLVLDLKFSESKTSFQFRCDAPKNSFTKRVHSFVKNASSAVKDLSPFSGVPGLEDKHWVIKEGNLEISLDDYRTVTMTMQEIVRKDKYVSESMTSPFKDSQNKRAKKASWAFTSKEEIKNKSISEWEGTGRSISSLATSLTSLREAIKIKYPMITDLYVFEDPIISESVYITGTLGREHSFMSITTDLLQYADNFLPLGVTCDVRLNPGYSP